MSPPPPSREEAFASAPIPEPMINVSPYHDGLAGLDTWFWSVDHDAVSVTVTARGWTVTGTVGPSEWMFETSDGGFYRADHPGREDFPVGRHYFARRGLYTSHTVVWRGGFTVSGYGLTFTFDNLANDYTASRDYTVIAIEAVGSGG